MRKGYFNVSRRHQAPGFQPYLPGSVSRLLEGILAFIVLLFAGILVVASKHV